MVSTGANLTKKSPSHQAPCGRRRQEMAVGKCGGLAGRNLTDWGGSDESDNGSLGKEGWFIFAWADKNAAKSPKTKGYYLG